MCGETIKRFNSSCTLTFTCTFTEEKTLDQHLPSWKKVRAMASQQSKSKGMLLSRIHTSRLVLCLTRCILPHLADNLADAPASTQCTLTQWTLVVASHLTSMVLGMPRRQ